MALATPVLVFLTIWTLTFSEIACQHHDHHGHSHDGHSHDTPHTSHDSGVVDISRLAGPSRSDSRSSRRTFDRSNGMLNDRQFLLESLFGGSSMFGFRERPRHDFDSPHSDSHHTTDRRGHRWNSGNTDSHRDTSLRNRFGPSRRGSFDSWNRHSRRGSHSVDRFPRERFESARHHPRDRFSNRFGNTHGSEHHFDPDHHSGHDGHDHGAHSPARDSRWHDRGPSSRDHHDHMHGANSPIRDTHDHSHGVERASNRVYSPKTRPRNRRIDKKRHNTRIDPHHPSPKPVYRPKKTQKPKKKSKKKVLKNILKGLLGGFILG